MGLESIKNKHSTRDRQVANCTRDLQVARMKNFSIGYLVFCSPREFSYVPSFPFREYIVLINLVLRTLCVSIMVLYTLSWASVLCSLCMTRSCTPYLLLVL
ncbi:hypothetical protein OIU74_030169 [Salix koriyanagi]|uniref:Uncharacterized protein n=1 Tax=Salix koriyanagi TaxID=2511006 RepID=A0A9Q0ZVA3_9ROSI|nr:hypothetical protein OIU74_030169 [Salix koriyanagi]